MIRRQNLSRRCFIAGGAALAALALLSHSSAAAEVDVVVVGAGAAGLAATRELLGRGVSAAALEASSRVGVRGKVSARLVEEQLQRFEAQLRVVESHVLCDPLQDFVREALRRRAFELHVLRPDLQRVSHLAVEQRLFAPSVGCGRCVKATHSTNILI